MADKRIKRKRRPSLLWSAIDRLTAIIYSFFTNGRIGDMLSSGNTLCNRSYLASTFNNGKRRASKILLKYSDPVMENGFVSRVIIFMRQFLASLRLNVYGVFFVFFGLASTIVTLVPALIGGMSGLNEIELITSAIITVCAIPLLFSSQTAAEAIFSSRTMSRLVLHFLCIPEEKMKTKKQYGGTIHVFIATVVAMVLGVLTYYFNPIIVPFAFLCICVTFLIFSSPESGVIITLALIPFLQYFSKSEFVLLVMVAVTAVSYLCKVLQRRRHLYLSPEISMVLLFCGFTIMGSIFSHGGVQTFVDSVVTIVLILGGFLLTYNLVNSKKLLSAAFKTLTVSFIVLCIMAVWESVYYGISNRIIDRVSPNISRLAGEKVLFLADNGIIFGMFAILIFPMLFSYMIKRKSVKGIAMIASLCVLAIIAAWMRCYYEIMIALMLECVIYWFMYSHKTMTAVIFAMIPIGIVMMLYPYAVKYLYWPNISEILMEYMPASITNSEMHPSVIRDTFAMVMDGNFVGIGAGNHAFMSLFPAYASVGSVGAENSMSLWLDILCWSGVFGFASFFIFVVLLVKRSCGYLIDRGSGETRGRALALFSGLMSAMLFGCVYSIWMDERVLFLFWACTGLLMSYIRLGRDSEEVRKTQFKDTDDAKDVEVVFYE